MLEDIQVLLEDNHPAIACDQLIDQSDDFSRTADCYENAAMESFFHSLKGECLDSQSFQTRVQARSVTFENIEAFYNCRVLRHSTLQYLSPSGTNN